MITTIIDTNGVGASSKSIALIQLNFSVQNFFFENNVINWVLQKQNVMSQLFTWEISFNRPTDARATNFGTDIETYTHFL